MQVEGIPDGWELMRIGRPAIGEFIVSHKGEPKEVFDEEYCGLDCVIIRKIEKPKRYRPFANAAEAEAMWDAVLKYKNPSPDREHSRYRIGFVSLGRVCIGLESYRYEEAFDVFECIDGTPFGVEVIDD